MIRCDLRLDGEPGLTRAVADFIGGLARQAGLPASKAYWLRLAAEEITTNIIQHGYRGRGPVELVGGMDAGRVWVRIEDEAPAFDPRGHDPRPRLRAEPAEREAGGYGLLLALNKVDDFAYDRTAGRNRNTLVMRRDSPGGSSGDSTEGRDHDPNQCPGGR